MLLHKNAGWGNSLLKVISIISRSGKLEWRGQEKGEREKERNVGEI